MASNAAPVKVAVIGSGLAGLAAAYYLAKAAAEDGIHGLEVHLFEKVRCHHLEYIEKMKLLRRRFIGFKSWYGFVINIYPSG